MRLPLPDGPDARDAAARRRGTDRNGDKAR